jgi:hypothetical protein
LRSLSSNLLGSILVHLLWSWIKEIGVPHARALSLTSPSRAEAMAVAVGVSCRVETSATFFLLAVGEEWWSLKQWPLLDLNDEP